MRAPGLVPHTPSLWGIAGTARRAHDVRTTGSLARPSVGLHQPENHPKMHLHTAQLRNCRCYVASRHCTHGPMVPICLTEDLAHGDAGWERGAVRVVTATEPTPAMRPGKLLEIERGDGAAERVKLFGRMSKRRAFKLASDGGIAPCSSLKPSSKTWSLLEQPAPAVGKAVGALKPLHLCLQYRCTVM